MTVIALAYVVAFVLLAGALVSGWRERDQRDARQKALDVVNDE